MEINNLAGIDPVSKQVLVNFFWRFYFDNAESLKIPVKVWIIKSSIKLKDLYWLFERLFGAPPKEFFEY